jgi:hypothetical protein
MARTRLVGAVATLFGGLLLVVSPFLGWLGVRAPGHFRTFTLWASLRELQKGGLLGPGMSATWVVASGALAVVAAVLALVASARTWRGTAAAGIVIGAGAGAYVGYLHGSLEYGVTSIAHVGSPRVPTIPEPGLFLAVVGAAAVLLGGLIQTVVSRHE